MTNETISPASEPIYYEIKLSRTVEVQGHFYRPGERHVVDEETLAAMGEAVAEKRLAR